MWGTWTHPPCTQLPQGCRHVKDAGRWCGCLTQVWGLISGHGVLLHDALFLSLSVSFYSSTFPSLYLPLPLSLSLILCISSSRPSQSHHGL